MYVDYFEYYLPIIFQQLSNRAHAVLLFSAEAKRSKDEMRI